MYPSAGDDAVFRRTSTSDTHSCAASNDDHDSTVGTLVVTGRGVGALEEEDELDQAEAGVPAKTEPAVGEEDAPCPTASTALERCGCYCRRYFNKWRGGVSKSMPRPPVGPILYGACASFLAVLAVAGLDVLLLHVPYEAFPLLLPPLGASTMLVLSMPDSHLAQPRSLIGECAIDSALCLCCCMCGGGQPAGTPACANPANCVATTKSLRLSYRPLSHSVACYRTAAALSRRDLHIVGAGRLRAAGAGQPPAVAGGACGHRARRDRHVLHEHRTPSRRVYVMLSRSLQAAAYLSCVTCACACLAVPPHQQTGRAAANVGAPHHVATFESDPCLPLGTPPLPVVAARTQHTQAARRLLRSAWPRNCRSGTASSSSSRSCCHTRCCCSLVLFSTTSRGTAATRCFGCKTHSAGCLTHHSASGT